MSSLPLPFPSHDASSSEVPAVPKIEQEIVDCLVCGGSDFDTVIVASDPLTGLGGNFRVVRCTDCGLHFTNPRPTEASIGQFYPDDYACWQPKAADSRWRTRAALHLEHLVLRKHFGYPGGKLTLWESLQAAAGRAVMRRSAQRQNWIPWRGPGRLLDFGCGAGDFMLHMRHHGWTPQGMDTSESCAEEVTRRTGIPVHVGTLPHADIEPESFDAVSMWNALEHVHDPRGVVRAAGEALRPGGILLVGVPCIDSWTFRKYQHDWYPLKVPRHLTHFTPDSLSETVNAEGFRVLSVDHVARPGFLRKSARCAVKTGHGSRWLKMLRFKQLAAMTAAWTERTGQADFIRAIAEKI